MTSNEIRQVIGMKPSEDPKADELRNKNLSEPSTGGDGENTAEATAKQKEENSK
jgi:hypothetical protein